MKSLITTALIVFSISKTQSQTSNNFIDSNGDTTAIVFLVGIIFSMMVIMLYKFLKIKQVTEENKIQKSPDLNIVLENLNQGIYFIRIQTERGLFYKRVVKE